MKALLFAILSMALVNAAYADVVVSLPAPQGGKLLCKNAERAAFIQEFANEMGELRKHIKKSLAENAQAKEDLDVSNMYGYKTDKSYVGDVSSSVEADRYVLKLTIKIPVTGAEKAVLVKHKIIDWTTQLDRFIVITGRDNCIVAL